MNKLIIPCLAAAFATAICQAAPADDVKAAARKLADAPNYSWTTTTQMAGGGGFGGGPVNGKAEKGGFTVIARETQNGTFQTVRKGEQVAIQNQEGAWMTIEEMAAARGGGAGGGRGGRGAGGAFGGGQQNPAEEVNALVAAAKDLKAADGVITGSLNDEAIAQRLTFGRGRGGQAPAAPKNAMGSVKFWVKDGAISKYEVQVKGTVAGRDGEERQVDRTTTTEIKDIGATKIDVPEAAKKKLGA